MKHFLKSQAEKCLQNEFKSLELLKSNQIFLKKSRNLLNCYKDKKMGFENKYLVDCDF